MRLLIYRPKVEARGGGGGVQKRAAPHHARAMIAASNPLAELPAPGAGCEGDNSQQLAAPRSQRTAKELYRGCEGRARGARATATLSNQAPSASPLVTAHDAVGPAGCARMWLCSAMRVQTRGLFFIYLSARRTGLGFKI